MANPVTSTLQKMILLAHQQYGIRFQLSTTQLVEFANMIQYIAYNKDVDAFVVWDQQFDLGFDAFLNSADNTYVAPIDTDIGLSVSSSVNGVLGTLFNYNTNNRRSKWIIKPPEGKAAIVFTDGETLTILSGSAASGVTVTGQTYAVSNGPYRMPDKRFGNLPFRKLIGITRVTDAQMFGTPPNTGFNGFDDYGLYLNSAPGRRQNFPFRYNEVTQEITLSTSQPLEITVTDIDYGGVSTPLTTSKARWIYYHNPPPITSITDDASVILPERYRYEVLFKGITLLADTATYGEAGTVRQLIEPVCAKFWEDMRDQYQQYGRDSDYISEGDTWDDTLYRNSQSNHAGPYSPGVNW